MSKVYLNVCLNKKTNMLDSVFKRLPIKESYFVTDTTSNFKVVLLQNENSKDIDIFHRETS